MRKLIQIQLTTAVQFQPPLGVQKIVATKVGPVSKAELVELPSGDVEVHVIGNKYSTLHLVHRESIVQKLYEVERLAEVVALNQPNEDEFVRAVAQVDAAAGKPDGICVPPKVAREHWKTRQKREREEAAKAAKSGT